MMIIINNENYYNIINNSYCYLMKSITVLCRVMVGRITQLNNQSLYCDHNVVATGHSKK